MAVHICYAQACLQIGFHQFQLDVIHWVFYGLTIWKENMEVGLGRLLLFKRVCVCVNVCVYVRMYVCMCMCVCVYVCMCVCLKCMYVFMFMYVCMDVCMYVGR